MKKLVVMKFGGSSVADAGKIKHVAGRVIEKKKAGFGVVVVVSAPGDMTDDLIEMAQEVSDDPSPRELDMLLATGEQASIALLCMALHSQGHDAISLTGPQAGIFADMDHTRARITDIQPKKVREQLTRKRIVVVAGFQGLNANEDITTLGRGGSDLTAIALAAALQADLCEIFTDVEGVYTTDPRVVPDARKLNEISYDEMLELAGSGAQVMQGRSVEVAKKFGVVFEVRSTFSKASGTRVHQEVSQMEDVVVSGIAFDRKQAKISMVDVPDRPGVAASIFGALAKAGVNVDMIIQSEAREGTNDISFTVSEGEVKKALSALDLVKHKLEAKELASDTTVAKVAVVGVGMRSHPGVASRMFQALADHKINIQMISTSEIKISCIISRSKVEDAVKVLHQEFGLGKTVKNR
ncbi:MAG: aspartate kinase [Elusimicrobiota bacterium]|jgi:aspartate kinase